MSAGTLDVHPLHPGGQTALEVARRVEAFVAPAQRTLDLALYDVRLPGEAGDLVPRGAARRRRARRGRCGSPTTPTTTSAIFPPPPRTQAGADPGAAVPDARRPRAARPDAPQVRRARRRGGLDRLDELDLGLVDAAGERDPDGASRPSSRRRSRRTSRSCGTSSTSMTRGLERADHGRRRQRPVRAWFTPGHGRRCRTGSRGRSAQRSGACGSRRR